MTNGDLKDFAELKDFLKWKRNNPDEYKQFLEDLKEFYKDMVNILKGVL